MRAKIEVEITRETLVDALAAYATQALPSAMVSILAQALDRAAEQVGSRQKDADWLCQVATELRKDVQALRADEDALFSK